MLISISDIIPLGTLILSGVIAIATVIYAIFTFYLAKATQVLALETKMMREFQTDPKLSVFLTSSIVDVILKNLVIQNIGSGPAYNVKFELSNDFTLYDGRKLSEIRIIKGGIPYIPPKEKYEFVITDAPYTKYADEHLTINATYQNSENKSISEKFIIDFSLWKNLKVINIDGINQVVNKLQEISNNLKNLGT